MGKTTPKTVLINRKLFFSSIRKKFGPFNQQQVNGFEVLLSAIEEHCTNIPEAAYLLATAWHETAYTMQPVLETLASSVDDAIARLEYSWKRGSLRWVKNPYWRKDNEGKSWLGRGYVQLTHKANYQKLGERVGADLVARPDLALVPSIASDILIIGSQEGLFTGKKLSEFVDESKRSYMRARQVINGTDMAERIASYAMTFEDAM
jgi:predicted chitinase